jgi:hypothetical protein
MSDTIRVFEVEINKINLKEGDVLLAKVKGPDFDNEETCEGLKHSLQRVFPNNKIGVLFMQGNEIDFTVISQDVAKALEKVSKSEESTCNPVSTCVDCNCGKKTKAEKIEESKEPNDESSKTTD